MNKARWALVVAVCSVSVVAFVAYRATAAKSRSSSLSNSAAENRNSGSGSPAAVPSVPLEISQRGPGMRSQGPDALKFPVPRTLDLTYVTAANFATALGDDPLRIFNYVRDEIAFESYIGCLRGPRGTLLALAGNSVDRASLLASMLQHAGQHVRFAHGTLPEPLARELVSSMWADRPQPRADTNTSDAAKAAVEKLVNSVQRDYKLIRDQLQKANVAFNAQSSPSLDSLIKETEDHYWVQWSKNGNWVDLDPSFSDSTPGAKYASATETLDALPDGLYHQVEIRIRIEEYTGNQASSRLIFRQKSRAVDLSGIDVVLSHEPENWNGPAASPQAALASAIQETGRIKPVVLVGGKDWLAGEPFYPKTPPTGGGMGGVFNALRGIGTRHEVPIATAESLELEFVDPNGQKSVVTREIFDIVGKDRRGKGEALSIDEVSSKSSTEDITGNAYSLFFSTGRISARHLSKLTDESTSDGENASEVDDPLRRINIIFSAASDGLIWRLGRRERGFILFYPDSPRVQISDLSLAAGGTRFSLDLRRTDNRAVASAAHAEDIFSARVLHGVVEGTLERFLSQYLIGKSGSTSELANSASLVFEQAQADDIRTILVRPNVSLLPISVSADTKAWIREDLSNGFIIVAPERQILLAQVPRFGWWRIDPHSGNTTAVTDEGLFQVEITFEEDRATHRVRVAERSYLGNGRWITEKGPVTLNARNALGFVDACLKEGLTLSQILEGGTL